MADPIPDFSQITAGRLSPGTTATIYGRLPRSMSEAFATWLKSVQHDPEDRIELWNLKRAFEAAWSICSSQLLVPRPEPEPIGVQMERERHRTRAAERRSMAEETERMRRAAEAQQPQPLTLRLPPAWVREIELAHDIHYHRPERPLGYDWIERGERRRVVIDNHEGDSPWRVTEFIDGHPEIVAAGFQTRAQAVNWVSNNHHAMFVPF